VRERNDADPSVCIRPRNLEFYPGNTRNLLDRRDCRQIHRAGANRLQTPAALVPPLPFSALAAYRISPFRSYSLSAR
jgi:hypothetical protein